MKRLLAVVLATAAAAAVAAAITLPAGADEQDAPDAAFVNCLRTNGLDIPADTRGVAIKQWMIAHDSEAVEDAIGKCQPDDRGPDRQRLVACLRDHGLQAPAAAHDLKQFLSTQTSDAAKTALAACGIRTGGEKDHASAAELASCLRKNGASAPDGSDPVALKNWIGAHHDEAAVADALKKCSAGFTEKASAPCGGDSDEPGDKAPAGTAPAPAPDEPKADGAITLQQ
jgi:hypothetical protein